jgi:hypothetical protein
MEVITGDIRQALQLQLDKNRDMKRFFWYRMERDEGGTIPRHVKLSDIDLHDYHSV